jgi:hypothetical protein
MSDVHPVDREVRLINLALEDIGNGWAVRLHVEPRIGTGRKRSHLLIVDRWNLWLPKGVRTRDQVDEALAEAVLQRRLPGID